MAKGDGKSTRHSRDAGSNQTDAAKNRLHVAVINASPYPKGRCWQLSREAVRRLTGAGCEALAVDILSWKLRPCIGCNDCADDASCIFQADQMAELVARLDQADAFLLVSPIYFAGPPAQLKAFFDRLQPLWAARYLLKRYPALGLEQRRPLGLLAVGGGGDPFGFEPLVSISRSAMRMLDAELIATAAILGQETMGAVAAGESAEERGPVQDGATATAAQDKDTAAALESVCSKLVDATRKRGTFQRQERARDLMDKAARDIHSSTV